MRERWDLETFESGLAHKKMAKFILSVGDNTFDIIASEAKKRDVTVQQLLRAVIVPEWVKQKLESNPSSIALRETAPHLMRESIRPSQRD